MSNSNTPAYNSVAKSQVRAGPPIAATAGAATAGATSATGAPAPAAAPANVNYAQVARKSGTTTPKPNGTASRATPPPAGSAGSVPPALPRVQGAAANGKGTHNRHTSANSTGSASHGGRKKGHQGTGQKSHHGGASANGAAPTPAVPNAWSASHGSRGSDREKGDRKAKKADGSATPTPAPDAPTKGRTSPTPVAKTSGDKEAVARPGSIAQGGNNTHMRNETSQQHTNIQDQSSSRPIPQSPHHTIQPPYNANHFPQGYGANFSYQGGQQPRGPPNGRGPGNQTINQLGQQGTFPSSPHRQHARPNHRGAHSQQSPSVTPNMQHAQVAAIGGQMPQQFYPNQLAHQYQFYSAGVMDPFYMSQGYVYMPPNRFPQQQIVPMAGSQAAPPPGYYSPALPKMSPSVSEASPRLSPAVLSGQAQPAASPIGVKPQSRAIKIVNPETKAEVNLKQLNLSSSSSAASSPAPTVVDPARATASPVPEAKASPLVVSSTPSPGPGDFSKHSSTVSLTEDEKRERCEKTKNEVLMKFNASKEAELKAEAERKAKEDAERKAKEDAERKVEEERLAKEEAVRKAEEERRASRQGGGRAPGRGGARGQGGGRACGGREGCCRRSRGCREGRRRNRCGCRQGCG
ncbi:uncharacterized protein V1510DRAFT_319814 [Dipodascopsis tothii]|uniref:uncharacterized protein n=1 Tax=Dipodascopsis tothii TaxID=44089 RepID=UPI0034CDDB57